MPNSMRDEAKVKEDYSRFVVVGASLLALFLLHACAIVPARCCTSICFDDRAYTEERSFCGCLR